MARAPVVLRSRRVRGWWDHRDGGVVVRVDHAAVVAAVAGPQQTAGVDQSLRPELAECRYSNLRYSLIKRLCGSRLLH
jgi:hypothetical protein